ncbi:MAG: hypothetical protein J0M20_11980 [Burkholderiales bacterium]|nr:hypothetical protein [Burkholderiales bacterium]
MKTYRIASIPGDGIGKEVVPAGQAVLQALADHGGGFAVEFETFGWGGDWYRAHGEMMPADGLAQLRGKDAILFGSAGDPDIPDHITLWGLRLKICQGFDQYANVRPTRILPGIESDGMGTRECNGGSQPSSFVHPDGTLWFATSRGMAVVHPESIGAGAPPPQVMIEDWRVDGRSLPLATGIEVPIGSRGFVFEFTATRLRAADKTRFRFRLLGYSSEWVDAGRRREAWFTNLDPGSYQFEVLAADGDGRWSPHAATFAFAVPTPFHRTPTFVLLTSLGIFGVLFLVHRLRTLNLRARNALLTERNRISRELHDTVAQGLVGIKVQLEVVKRHLDADSPAMEPLCRVQGIADATADEARRSVWALRDGATLDVALEDALSPVAEAVLVNSPVSYRIRCEGSRVRLAGTEQHHVLRIVREALVNVLRHADARSVLIEVHGEPHRATVTLSDDGRGFDPEAMHARSFGLIGMQERAGMLRGGRLYVTSAPGQGTRIRLEWEPDAHGAP